MSAFWQKDYLRDAFLRYLQDIMISGIWYLKITNFEQRQSLLFSSAVNSTVQKPSVSPVFPLVSNEVLEWLGVALIASVVVVAL